MKLTIFLSLSLLLTSAAYGVSCRYNSTSNGKMKEITASCSLKVEGKSFEAKGHGSSQIQSLARSEACMECRSQLTQNLPDDIKRKYQNADGSFTMGRGTLIAPKKIPDGDESYKPDHPAKKPHSKIGEQDEGPLSCMKVSKYAYCSDGNFYEPVAPEKNSKLQKVVARVLSNQRNTIKKVPGPEDGDSGFNSGFDR